MTEVESDPVAVPELKDEHETEKPVSEGGSPSLEEGEGDSTAEVEAKDSENATGDENNNDPPPSSIEEAKSESAAASEADKLTKNPKSFKRNSSSFLRVSDLDFPSPNETTSSDENRNGSADGDEEDQLSHFHHPSADPPPGMDKDDKEKFIAIGSHDGVSTPIAPVATQKLAAFGLETALNQDMWKPDRRTQRLIQKAAPEQDWIPHTFSSGGLSVGESCNFYDKEVFVWTGTFSHDYYGCDLPAIRVSGTVNMSAEYLVDLLLDSSRVKEYNRLMIERKDVQVFVDDLYQEKSDSESNPFGPCVTKFTRATSKPPLVNRIMVFNNLCHAKKLPDDSGYLVCNRAIYNSKQPEDEPANVINSEVLLGVNLIRHLRDKEGQILPNKCVMTNVNHMRSPKIPMMIAKKIGTSAAIGYLNDFRGAAERLAAQKVEG
mmetsp:Transcript_14567/g.35203  ORF Transcript_14567/g.35203 Transcript_14567/m.35203 type:complete len:434 (-) Transcript_14567:179-1480(-)|eukprot:CAMPEP_0113633340 /NCGR_PEP_ID=MMETSP0017_2-20120614/17350_1 /TAXON_ID=2856 /ORGANISM="Cylindrotheca closterium" /LENGTH=433 /DNA_ID=CAMNT_0000543973 /DNA_START=207 /DNA_END=1508 /DNA_ORIENTATION=- /assembly_acc=CAM_ASM_000147